ncbi:hypothetical protein [Tsukamurella spumae]|uniref:Uncharacterized protein n=1 Tax=Tsukamurella spumae TaxID=44753 RepID=A0A846X6V1_9ACTN|nr:hypothetical protein [Tsukamurella spumae]NKY19500.1 hypothetical protein [Tsukamurella spumae]
MSDSYGRRPGLTAAPSLPVGCGVGGLVARGEALAGVAGRADGPDEVAAPGTCTEPVGTRTGSAEAGRREVAEEITKTSPAPKATNVATQPDTTTRPRRLPKASPTV